MPVAGEREEKSFPTHFITFCSFVRDSPRNPSTGLFHILTYHQKVCGKHWGITFNSLSWIKHRTNKCYDQIGFIIIMQGCFPIIRLWTHLTCEKIKGKEMVIVPETELLKTVLHSYNTKQTVTTKLLLNQYRASLTYIPINWLQFDNIVKSKVHLIHLTHYSLALPTLDVFRTVSLAYSWAKSNTNLFYNKMSTISRNLLNAVLKWQAEWLSGSRLVASVSVVCPRELGCLGPEAPCPASRERIGQHVAGND